MTRANLDSAILLGWRVGRHYGNPGDPALVTDVEKLVGRQIVDRGVLEAVAALRGGEEDAPDYARRLARGIVQPPRTRVLNAQKWNIGSAEVLGWSTQGAYAGADDALLVDDVRWLEGMTGRRESGVLLTAALDLVLAAKRRDIAELDRTAPRLARLSSGIVGQPVDELIELDPDDGDTGVGVWVGVGLVLAAGAVVLSRSGKARRRRR